MSWDEIWVDVAYGIARRSYDPRHQVGAVIVTGDNTQVLAVGYNGNYAGGPNEVESETPGESGMLHAEINALLKLDYNNPKRKKIVGIIICLNQDRLLVCLNYREYLF